MTLSLKQMNDGDYIDEKRTEFESSILNRKIVSIKNIDKNNIKFIIEKCKQNNFDYIVSQIDTNQPELISAMIDNGFRIYGGNVVLKNKLKGEYKINIKVREYEKKDLKQIKQMTRGAFPKVHWYNNKYLNKDKIDEMYVKWVENSCNGRADIVFVYEENDKVLGYLTCYKRLELLVVSSEARRKGVGSALVRTGLDYYKNKNFKEVSLKVEMLNIPVLNLHLKCGSELHSVVLNINKWLK